MNSPGPIRLEHSRHLTRAPGEDAALEILQGHSITYRIAVGPHEGRLSLTPQGRVRYTLKTPYRDGTNHVVFTMKYTKPALSIEQQIAQLQQRGMTFGDTQRAAGIR